MTALETLRAENIQLRNANEHLRELLQQRNATIADMASRLSAIRHSATPAAPNALHLAEIETALRHEVFRLRGIGDDAGGHSDA